jgi:hypothetical protein
VEASMGKWVKVALVILIALAVVNDVGRYLMAVYRIDDRTRTMAFEAARIAKANPASQSAWPTVAKAAQEAGLEVVGYQQSAAGVSVQTRIHVGGTWAIGPVWSLLLRQPLNTPFVLDRSVTATG